LTGIKISRVANAMNIQMAVVRRTDSLPEIQRLREFIGRLRGIISGIISAGAGN